MKVYIPLWSDLILGSLLGGAALISLTGCAEDGPAAPVYTPESGPWSYTAEGLLTNSCGTDDLYMDIDQEFLLYDNGNGTFTVDQGAAGSFDCQIDGEQFSCPERLSDSTDFPELGITINWKVRIDGTFESPTSMSGIQRVDFGCEGEACGFAMQLGLMLPCVYEYGFTATADSF